MTELTVHTSSKAESGLTSKLQGPKLNHAIETSDEEEKLYTFYLDVVLN